MELLSKFLIGIVAFEHLLFLYIEMFAWETVGKKTFRSFPPHLFGPTKAMAANQGLYNGFLAAGLIWSLIESDPYWYYRLALFFLGCVVVAGAYGAYSVSKRIFTIQALPALLAIAALALSRL